jgi:hypothetical protein
VSISSFIGNETNLVRVVHFSFPTFSLLLNSRDRQFGGDPLSSSDAGGCGEPRSHRPPSLLVFRLVFLKFLGLGFLLSSAAYGLEAVAGGAELRDALGGAMRGLAHPKALASSLPLLRRPYLEGGCGMWCGREVGLSTLLVAPTLAIFLDLVKQHGGAALNPSSLMVSLRFLVSESLRRQIRNPQAGTDGGDVGLADARCFWLLYVGVGSDVGGRLSLCPFLCGTVGFHNGIPWGGGGRIFWSVVASQPPATNGFSSPPVLKTTADIRSTFMMHLSGVAGCEILRHCQGLTPLVEGGGGFGGSPASSGGSKIV